MEEWKATIHGSRHTLYPVCGESADNVVGILNAKDYFRLEEKGREAVMRTAVIMDPRSETTSRKVIVNMVK